MAKPPKRSAASRSGQPRKQAGDEDDKGHPAGGRYAAKPGARTGELCDAALPAAPQREPQPHPNGAEPAAAHRWAPFSALTAPDIAAADSDLAARIQRWRDMSQRLPAQQLRALRDRINREWAIETGVIEHLYTLDERTTRLLIQRGIDATLIADTATDQPPQDVAAMVQDHADTADWLFELAGTRPLCTSLIKQMHQFLTRKQLTATGFDIFGRRTEIPLRHGDYKIRPNNPLRAGDRKLHEYSPPEQVASEIDRLIAAHHDHSKRQVPADVAAAWLHHRFVQIHPFQDGNGRVGRAIASLALIESGWFPLVVTRHDRPEYLQALSDADAGSLTPLVSLLGQLQQRCIDEAFRTFEEPASPP